MFQGFVKSLLAMLGVIFGRGNEQHLALVNRTFVGQEHRAGNETGEPPPDRLEQSHASLSLQHARRAELPRCAW